MAYFFQEIKTAPNRNALAIRASKLVPFFRRQLLNIGRT
jgi:hypothetical protein